MSYITVPGHLNPTDEQSCIDFITSLCLTGIFMTAKSTKMNREELQNVSSSKSKEEMQDLKFCLNKKKHRLGISMIIPFILSAKQ